jgi:hypothetical protein
MKKALLAIPMLLASAAYADTINLVGVNGVTDGPDYVLPYYLSINGAAPIPADCYDFFHDSYIGQTWIANIFSLNEAIQFGQFSKFPNAAIGYMEIAILNTFTYGTPGQQIDLQHTIWNIFDPIFTVDAGMQADLAEADALLDTFNYSHTLFVEGLPDQAFVVTDTSIVPTPQAPEPSTWFLVGAGIVLITVSKCKSFQERN